MSLIGRVDTLCRLTPHARPPSNPYLPPGAPPATRNRTSVERYVHIVLRDAEIPLPSLPLPPDAPRRRLRRRAAPPTEEDAPYVEPCEAPCHILRITYVRAGGGAYQKTFVSLLDVQRACGFTETATQVGSALALLDLSDIAFAYAPRKASHDVVLHMHCTDRTMTAHVVFVSAEWALARLAATKARDPAHWTEACELVAAEIAAKNAAWLAMRGEEERPPGLLREPFSRYRPPVVTVDSLQRFEPMQIDAPPPRPWRTRSDPMLVEPADGDDPMQVDRPQQQQQQQGARRRLNRRRRFCKSAAARAAGAPQHGPVRA